MKTTLWERFIVAFCGRKFRRLEIRKDWKAPLKIYLAWCSEHGYYEDYKHSWTGYLICDKCFAEETDKEIQRLAKDLETQP